MSQTRKFLIASTVAFALAMAYAPSAVFAETASPAPVLTDKSPAAELAFWNSIKDSTNPDDFRAYLENFPNGMFHDPALDKFEKAGGAKSALPAAALATGGTDGGNTVTTEPPKVSEPVKPLTPVKIKKKTVTAKKTTKTTVASTSSEPKKVCKTNFFFGKKCTVATDVKKNKKTVATTKPKTPVLGSGGSNSGDGGGRGGGWGG